MTEVMRSPLLTDECEDKVVVSLVRTILALLSSPFAIVLAMRPQREREAAKIAEEFHCLRFARD
jgi:hypothetical protein